MYFASKDLEQGPELSVVGSMASCCLEGRPLFLLRFTPSSFEVEGSSRIHLYNWRGEASEVFGSEVRGAIFLGLPLGLLGTLGSTFSSDFSSGILGRPLRILALGRNTISRLDGI